jgi:CelD/BcsL family acetyltransferase involved in cellulose biosynthesis
VVAGIATEVIEDTVSLRAFLPEWTRFLRVVQPPSPFQTPKWLFTWWSHFGNGSLHVLVLKHSGRICRYSALFPPRLESPATTHAHGHWNVRLS